MENKIYELIENNGGGVSFVEMTNAIEESKGDFKYSMESKDFSNCILWDGLSSEFISSLENLLNDQKIIACMTTVSVYMIDGCILKLPLVKKRCHYKKPHWYPVVFWTDEQAKKRGIFEDFKRKKNETQ